MNSLVIINIQIFTLRLESLVIDKHKPITIAEVCLLCYWKMKMSFISMCSTEEEKEMVDANYMAVVVAQMNE